MKLQPLPSEINKLLKDLQAPAKLVAHLTLVHATAFALVGRLKEYWPDLDYDQQAVLIGAATHDIGKIQYPQELTHAGDRHEQAGPALLTAHGLSEHYARFARTHARWQHESTTQLEDLLVAFADKIWKGARDQALEQEIVQHIAQSCREESWNVYLKLDDIANELAEDAHEKILWQEATL